MWIFFLCLISLPSSEGTSHSSAVKMKPTQPTTGYPSCSCKNVSELETRTSQLGIAVQQNLLLNVLQKKQIAFLETGLQGANYGLNETKKRLQETESNLKQTQNNLQQALSQNANYSKKMKSLESNVNALQSSLLKMENALQMLQNKMNQTEKTDPTGNTLNMNGELIAIERKKGVWLLTS